MLEFVEQPLIQEGPTANGSVISSFREFSAGAGSNVAKANSEGFFIGAGDFSSAPFRVDYNGNLTATSATFPGVAQITVFKQNGIPTALHAGDLWFDTDDNNKIYRADAAGADQITTGEWVLLNDLRAADALTQTNGGTLTGALNINVTNVKIDGANKRIIINDGTNDRVLIGYLASGF